MTTEPRHLELVPAPGHTGPEQAEQVYAHLAVMVRRCTQLERVTASLATSDDAWTSVHTALVAGTRALETARLGIPDGLLALNLTGQTLHVGRLVVDPDSRRAWLADVEVALTPRELDLLVLMARTPARVIDRNEFLRVVWNFRSEGRSRTVDTHLARLRRRLVEAGAHPGEYVLNCWGAGWSLVAPSGPTRPDPGRAA